MSDQAKPSESAPAPGARPRREPITTATDRIQVIIEAAEKAAEGILEDAEAQARRYLAESRVRADRIADERARAMTDVTDALLERAESVKHQSDQLIAALDHAKLQIQERTAGEAEVRPLERQPEPIRPSEADPPPRVPHLKPVEPEPAPERPADPFQRPPQEPFAARRRSEEAPPPAPPARLVAMQMAVAGKSRAEIERRLREEFGIDDAGEMLDGILGPES
jgi:hypothetical protein